MCDLCEANFFILHLALPGNLSATSVVLQLITSVFVFIFRDELFALQFFVARHETRQAPDLVIDLDQVALELQPVLFDCEFRIAKVVELFADFGFAGNHVELQRGIGKIDQRLAFLNERSFFHQYVLDPATVDCVQVDRALGLDRCPQWDEILVDAGCHLRGANALTIQRKRGTRIEGREKNDEQQHSSTGGAADDQWPAGLLFNATVHAASIR